jgi:hypothetical protein
MKQVIEFRSSRENEFLKVFFNISTKDGSEIELFMEIIPFKFEQTCWTNRNVYINSVNVSHGQFFYFMNISIIHRPSQTQFYYIPVFFFLLNPRQGLKPNACKSKTNVQYQINMILHVGYTVSVGLCRPICMSLGGELKSLCPQSKFVLGSKRGGRYTFSWK